ncbi:MAG: CbtB-domain containing protein [Cocleimonas sp.]|nr:CbtB-domain containing protein [Cocleimonas sp.]
MKATHTLAHTPSLSFSATLQIIATSLLALVILYGVGFSEVSIAHNSAHDARHATAFPCH